MKRTTGAFLPHTHTHFLTQIFSHAHSHTPPHMDTLTHSLVHSQTHTLTHSLTHSQTHTPSLSHTQTHTDTQTHTHNFISLACPPQPVHSLSPLSWWSDTSSRPVTRSRRRASRTASTTPTSCATSPTTRVRAASWLWRARSHPPSSTGNVRFKHLLPCVTRPIDMCVHLTRAIQTPRV